MVFENIIKYIRHPKVLNVPGLLTRVSSHLSHTCNPNFSFMGGGGKRKEK